MTRRMMLTLCLLLVASVFAGCAEAVLQDQNPAAQTPPTTTQRPTDVAADMLTEEKIQEIEQAWLASMGELPQWYIDLQGRPAAGIRYYGTYNGFDILFKGTAVGADTTKTIGGVSFTYSNSFVLYAYADGVFYELEEAYADGLISQESLKAAADIHLGYENRVHGNSNVIEAMKLAFLSKYVTDGDWSTKDLSVVYYGEYDGAHVGFINGIFGYTQALCTEMVGQYAFHYNTGQKLQVYYDGQIMGLKEAYDQGILSDEAVGLLYKAYAKAPVGEKE